MREIDGRSGLETTIVLADDHALVRDVLHRYIDEHPGLRIVAEASEGRELVEAVRAHRPDVAIVDLWMPGLSGADAAREITQNSSSTRVLILTMHEDLEHVREALRAGASGYVVKTAPVRQLLDAIAAVSRGDSYISPSVSHHLVRSVRGDESPGPTLLSVLTPREREVTQLIAEGLSAKEIAMRLGVSVKTAEAHRAHVMAKLGVRKTSMLVRIAIREGLIQT